MQGYFQGEHLILGIIEVAIFLGFIIPYQSLILFSQWCLKFRFLAYYLPIVDTNVAPFKDKYRFWFGIRLDYYRTSDHRDSLSVNLLSTLSVSGEHDSLDMPAGDSSILAALQISSIRYLGLVIFAQVDCDHSLCTVISF